MESTVPVVAVDGPSGSGKGTVAAQLAAELGWHLLDSGALYRLVAFAAGGSAVELDDESQVARVARELPVSFEESIDGIRVMLDGRDVGDEIRTERAGDMASRVARLPMVRAALFERQRSFAVPPGLVADGRDMGTVVFPEAVLKVFLTASTEERARRRHKQLKEKGIDVSLRDLSRDVAERDQRDSSRPVAPLKPAHGARIMDSTNLTSAEVVSQIIIWLAAIGIAPRAD